MDEKDKEIEGLKDQVATLTAKVTSVTADLEGSKKENETLTKTVGEKDGLIAQKNKDLVLQRGQYKKISERSKEELEAMTDSEKEALKRSEETEAKLAKFETETADRNKREFDARKNSLVTKFAGKNTDIAKKIEENLGKLDPALLSKAITEADLAPLVELAYNALGTLKPEPIKSAVNGGNGDPANPDAGQNFADTPEGQAMLGVLAPKAVEKKA